MSLTEYKRKRSFGNTPEPEQGGRSGKQRVFVVQLHHASHRHYDFRLELDGTLKSWAVPKGPSFDPLVKRLAMEVEDHPIAYATFEGDIPKGNYGAGHVDIFDHGTWEPIGDASKSLAKGELKFILHGDVLRGSWALVRTRKQRSKQQWLLIKHQDEYAGPREANDFVDQATDRPISVAARKETWKKEKVKTTRGKVATADTSQIPEGATPTRLRNEAFAPELCRAQPKAPQGQDWLHEIKWDGYRIVATVVGRKVRLWSRNAIEWTAKVPELSQAIASLNLENAQLDGEMIVLQDGRDDFNALQARLGAQNKAQLVYMLFDLVHLDGWSFRDVALVERKRRLAALLETTQNRLLRFSEHHVGQGREVFDQAVAAGVEGIVSKRVGSPYRGERNGDWVKVKGRNSNEFIVIGYTRPKGSRSGIGALLLATPTDGALRYIGRVGTGFSDAQLKALAKRLRPHVIHAPTADIALMSRADRTLAIWVEPTLVVEVFFHGIGGKGLLRQSSLKALREDKGPEDLEESAVKKKSTGATKPASGKRAQEKAATSISHPERIVFGSLDATKADVAAYYKTVAQWILPEIVDRPLAVVRCPDGVAAQCFFQKHVGRGWGANVHGIDVKDKTSRQKYLFISDEHGLLELVQMNVIEFHPWGSTNANLERADRIVFDLDPHASVKWPRVKAGARALRKQLDSIGLCSYLRTSGGKGLHVVVPLNPPAPWDEVKAFAHAVASAMTALQPKEFVDTAGEKNRAGRIFIDWLRNGRGSTSIASYSLRARPSAGVAMPIAWSALDRVKSGDEFTIENTPSRLARRKNDPWSDIASISQSLPDAS